MMSIVEQFGKKRNKIEPEIPMPRVVYTPAPHEKHAQSLVYVADLVDDNQKLTIENEKLRSDLRLAVMRIKDLETPSKKKSLARSRCHRKMKLRLARRQRGSRRSVFRERGVNRSLRQAAGPAVR